MKFGLFDHVDVNDRPLAQQFDERIQYVQAAEEAGFYCYHVAEHHATPLNMVPVPGVYLGALARETSKIRLGPLCYLLPLYSPLRLIEEVCILDHLCRGRLDVGVGRGVSPFELNFHNVDPETSREVFQEALAVLVNGLTHDVLNHEGKHFHYKDVPMELKPLQQPHPPIWYPSSYPAGAEWGGTNGYQMVTLGGVEHAKSVLDAYRGALKINGNANPKFDGGAAMGISRQVIVADTDAEALKLAEPAYEKWHASLTKLWRVNQVQGPAISKNMPETLADAVQNGSAIVGSPDSVRENIKSQMTAMGANYLVSAFYIGDLPHDAAMRSLDLFSSEVMPSLRDL